jgi:GlpG protein
MNTGFFVPIVKNLTFSVKALDADGQFHDTGFAAILHGQGWRLVTPIFLHFGLAHLFFNMMAMRYLGEKVEMRKGTWRFAVLVVVSAIASNCGESLMTKGETQADQLRIFGGMSGVIFAVAGYLWIKGHTDPGDHLSLNQQSVNWMLGWFLLGIIAPLAVPEAANQGFPFNMANVAHGVGLATGVVFGLLRF